jgi:hypothetical protein
MVVVVVEAPAAQHSTAQPFPRGQDGVVRKVCWLHNPASLLFQTSDHEPRGNRADSEAAPATPHQSPTMLCLVHRDTTSPPVLTRSAAEIGFITHVCQVKADQ